MVKKLKNERINWKLGLKCSYQFWPWPRPWPWIFNLKFSNSHISEIRVLIHVKQKGNKLTDCWANNMTLTCDCTHVLDHGFSRFTLQWRHNGHNGIPNHQPHNWLLKCLSRHTSRPKLRVTGLCEGNSPVTGEFPAQRASNMENVSIWWRHHEFWNSRMSGMGMPIDIEPKGSVIWSFMSSDWDLLVSKVRCKDLLESD